jgi:hypothetical protein
MKINHPFVCWITKLPRPCSLVPLFPRFVFHWVLITPLSALYSA